MSVYIVSRVTGRMCDRPVLGVHNLSCDKKSLESAMDHFDSLVKDRERQGLEAHVRTVYECDTISRGISSRMDVKIANCYLADKSVEDIYLERCRTRREVEVAKRKAERKEAKRARG